MPWNRLRAVYPNVMQIVPSEDAIAGAAESGLAAARVDHRKVTDLELFCDFYAQVTGEKLSDRGRSGIRVRYSSGRRQKRRRLRHEADSTVDARIRTLCRRGDC